jgi:surface antigen
MIVSTGSALARLRRRAAMRRCALPGWRLTAVAGIVFAVGACSMANPLGSLTARNQDDKPTGSIAPVKAIADAAAQLQDSDLAVARDAATVALDQGSDATAPWENPETGARGTVTPIASAYSQGGAECRDFLASYVRDKAESWLQGEACRNAFGHWEVRNFRPWKRAAT